MRALGETAAHLPWLSPRAASLVALARSPAALAWTQLRPDPAGVLLVLSQAGDAPPASFLALLPAFAGMYIGIRVRKRLSAAVFMKWFFAGLIALGGYMFLRSIKLV